MNRTARRIGRVLWWSVFCAVIAVAAAIVVDTVLRDVDASAGP